LFNVLSSVLSSRQPESPTSRRRVSPGATRQDEDLRVHVRNCGSSYGSSSRTQSTTLLQIHLQQEQQYREGGFFCSTSTSTPTNQEQQQQEDILFHQPQPPGNQGQYQQQQQVNSSINNLQGPGPYAAPPAQGDMAAMIAMAVEQHWRKSNPVWEKVAAIAATLRRFLASPKLRVVRASRSAFTTNWFTAIEEVENPQKP
jgi:hypothetical protein